MDKIRVLIGTPLKGEVSDHYATTLARLFAGEIPGVEIQQAFMGGTCVFGARDILASQALEGGYDKLLFWDADVRANVHDFVRILSHPESFVCGAYSRRTLTTHWHFFTEPDSEILPNGLLQVDQSAIGFSVIDCSVLKKLKELHPEMGYKNKEGKDADVKHYHQFFPWQIIGENTAREKMIRLQELMANYWGHAGHATDTLVKVSKILEADDYSKNLMQGEDYGFCRMVREAGIPIWVDMKLVLQHSGTCAFPIESADLVKMTAEGWRAPHWEKLRQERVAAT